jgi:hypoxanthine phosphoribosyltransferase
MLIMMLKEIQQVQATADLLYSERQVEAALDNMAAAINDLLAGSNPLVLCVMNGGIVVAGKLLTRLAFPLNIDAINASRYQNQTSGGVIEWVLKPGTPLTGRVILKEYCLELGATAVYCAVLVDKLLDHKKPIQADFVGLQIENRYLFGYGMDYKGYLRNAAGIYACNGDV